MLLRLSKNAFVRQFGPFTYILNRLNAYDEMFTDAEVFMRWITRTAMPKSEIVANICKVYTGTDPQIIGVDFDEFIAQLIEEKVILVGENEAEIAAKDESFSYEVENPKTMDTHIIKPENMPKVEIPQDVLEK